MATDVQNLNPAKTKEHTVVQLMAYVNSTVIVDDLNGAVKGRANMH